MAGASDFKVKKGLQVHGGDINLGNAQNAVIQVDAVSGTDTAGKNLTISAGEGTGTGAGGSIIFQTADGGGSSNSNATSLVTALTIADDLSSTFAGAVSLNGAVTLGNATGDDITVTGRLASDLIPKTDSAYDLGSSSLQFAEAHIDTGHIDALTVTGTSTLTTVDINGGAVDGTTVGASSASSGAFTTLAASSAVTFGSDGNGVDVTFHSGTSGDNMLWDSSEEQLKIIGTSGQVALDIDTGNLTVGAYGLTDAGVATIASMGGNWTNASRTITDLGTVTTADINGGSIDGTVIGAASAVAGTFAAIVGTSLNVSDGNITNVGDINADSLSVDDAAVGLDIQFGGNTTLNKITLTDNLADALNINEGGTSYMKFVTSDSGEKITMGKRTDFSGGVYADQIQALDTDTDVTVKMSDNRLGAVNFMQGSDSYMKIVTANGSESIVLSPLANGDGVSSVVIGDAGAEDTMLVFDGAENDYRMGINDDASGDSGSLSNVLEIGAGSVHGTTPAIVIDGSANVVTLGVDNPSDGDVLTYTTTGTNRWKPASASSAAISTSANNGSSSATDNTILYYNGASNSSVQSSANLIFNDTDLQIAGAGKTQYRDGDIYIHSSTDGQLDIDANVEIEMATASLDIDATTSVTIDTPDLKINGSASGKPVLTLTNTNADGDGATVKLVKDGSSPAAEDIVGTISFSSEDDGSNTQVYGTIVTKIEDPGAGSEQGKMLFNVAENDGTVTQGLALTGSGTNGEIDVTIGAGSSSVTTIVGDLTVSGTTTTVSSTTLEVTDDLITVSKGNDTIANADGSGVEIDATGATNLYWKYVHSNTAWTSNVDIDTATTSDVYKIAGTSVLTNNTLGSGVVSSSLTSVGALNSGSITSGFGTIDTGSSAITTTGLITGGSLDIDDVVINGTTIGHTDDTDLLTVADGSLTLAGTLNQESIVLMDSYSDTLTTTSATTMFTLASNTYSAAKVIVSVWLDDGSDHRSVGEYLFTYQGASSPSASSNIHMTEYALVETGGSALATFDAVKSSGNILFQITPGSSTSTKVRAQITQFVI